MTRRPPSPRECLAVALGVLICAVVLAAYVLEAE